MITRKRLWFYHFCFFAGMGGMLLATVPGLAPAVIMFGLLYMTGLTVLLVTGWLTGTQLARARVRWPAAILGMVALWLGMTAVAGPGPGVFALLLSVVSLWPRRITPA